MLASGKDGKLQVIDWEQNFYCPLQFYKNQWLIYFSFFSEWLSTSNLWSRVQVYSQYLESLADGMTGINRPFCRWWSVTSKILAANVFKLFIIYPVIPIYDLIRGGEVFFLTFFYTWGKQENQVSVNCSNSLIRSATVTVIVRNHIPFPCWPKNHFGGWFYNGFKNWRG